MQIRKSVKDLPAPQGVLRTVRQSYPYLIRNSINL